MGESGFNVPNLNIGAAIEKRMASIKMTQAEFARRIGMPQSNASRILKKESMDTSRLATICSVLQYNFFEEFCGRGDKAEQETGYQCPIVHVGSSIEAKLREIKMTQTEFARLLGVKQPEASRLLKRESMDTAKLVTISNILKYNFFENFCEPQKARSAADLIRELQGQMKPVPVHSEMEFTADEFQKFLIQQMQLPEEKRVIKITIEPK